LTLNICIAYTSHDEISQAMESIKLHSAKLWDESASPSQSQSSLSSSLISTSLLDQCMYCRDDCEPELLIRTSGETRLSDFLTWQCGFTFLSILQVMWPDFSLWHLLPTMLEYQRMHPTYASKKQAYLDKIKEMEQQSTASTGLENKKIQAFLQERQRLEQLALIKDA